MPMNGAPPATSTAQKPQPSRVISALKRSIMASLSARLDDEPSNSTTSGWVFNSKKADRSMSLNGRSTSRDVATVGPAGTEARIPEEVVATTPTRRADPSAAFTTVSAAQR